jgi:hypothetical protein
MVKRQIEISRKPMALNLNPGSGLESGRMGRAEGTDTVIGLWWHGRQVVGRRSRAGRPRRLEAGRENAII